VDPSHSAGDGVGWAASVPAAAHVFVAGLADVLEVSGDDGHHLARVLRLRPGESVTAADGSGHWRPYAVASVSRGEVRLEASGNSKVEPQLSPALAVAFAITKGTKPELTVQKLTELGVERILPVIAQRSVARPEPDSGAHGRWRRVVTEAACQCRRARLPELAAPAPLGELAGHPALVVAERGAPPPEALATPPGGEILVVVGPEGGLEPAEVDALRPWARIGLGPHVLRAETAALAAAAALVAARMGAIGGG
jgi:16S rRNA (uracil1498-N3)-methyltransferase